MPSTPEVIALARSLNALAATLAADARAAERRGELAPAAVDDILDRVFLPLLNQAGAMIAAQDSALLAQANHELRNFSEALQEFEDELENLDTAETLLAAGLALVGGAAQLAAFVVNPTPEGATEAAKAIAASVKELTL